MGLTQLSATIGILFLASVLTHRVQGIDGTSCAEFDEVSVLQVYTNMVPAGVRQPPGIRQPPGVLSDVGGDAYTAPLLGSFPARADTLAEQEALSLVEQIAEPSPVRLDDETLVPAKGADEVTAQELRNTLLEVQKARARAPTAEQNAAVSNVGKENGIGLSVPELTVAAEKRARMESTDEAGVESPALGNLEMYSQLGDASELRANARTQESHGLDALTSADRNRLVSRFDTEVAQLDALIQQEKATVASQDEAIREMKTPMLPPQSLSQEKTMPRRKPSPSPAETSDDDNWKVDKAVLLAMEFLPFLGALGVPRFYMGCWMTGTLQLIVCCLSCGIVGHIWGLIDLILIVHNALNGSNSIHAFGMHADFVEGSLETAKTLAWMAIVIWVIYGCGVCFGYGKYAQMYY